jgi:hypothetical protein
MTELGWSDEFMVESLPETGKNVQRLERDL